MATSPIFTGSTGDSKRDVPLLGPLLIAVFAIGLIALAWWQYQKKEIIASGSIQNLKVIEQPGREDAKSIIVSADVHLKNDSERPLVYYSSEATLDANGGPFKDEPGGVSDVPRYFQAYPDLKSNEKPLTPDTKLAAHQELVGVIVLSFPVSKQTFDQRKGLSISVNFRDQAPVVIK
jgi:hypothetical protein